MPAVNKPQTSLALIPEPEVVASQSEGNMGQPRQPSSLQGLLRFAMEATKTEDAPHDSVFQPLDEERKRFLENALKSMTIDVVEVLQKQIQTLRKIENLKPGDDTTEFVEAIDTILEYVDNIDIANDFHKIGGFTILYPCLKCSNAKVRAGGCELLAVLCQNNTYCQKIVLDNEFIPMLLSLIEKDEDTIVAVKAIYALGGIVRENSEGLNQLLHYNGLSFLLNTLKRNNEKFTIKATFLLSSLCRSSPEIKDHLINLGFVSTLISLISMERLTSHEHVLSLLVCLVENNVKAISECKNPSLKLKEVLQRYLASIRSKEECQEEEEYCKRLLHILNSEC
nr:hsp70-binding protein 1-like [Leptinotarsa decemlineata]XP_023014472.1 hsp70-binding protein 1-like [Leptinotarsa decemlineata]